MSGMIITIQSNIMWSLNDYTPTPTTDFVGWYRLNNSPNLEPCNMHSSDFWPGNWTERLIDDLDDSTDRTSWGRGIDAAQRSRNQFVSTRKYRGNFPGYEGVTVIEVTYKTFKLWLANSHRYPSFIKDA